MKSVSAGTFLLIATAGTNVGAQECAAGPADHVIDVIQDTVPVPLALAHQMVQTRLRSFDYVTELADPERHQFLTEPISRRPRLSVMVAHTAYEPPPVQLAVTLTATADSASTLVTHAVRALCRVNGASSDSTATAVETVFEVAANAELTNALLALTEDEKRHLRGNQRRHHR